MSKGMGLNVKISVSSTLTALAKVLKGGPPELERLVAEATPHIGSDGWAVYHSTGKRKMNSFPLTLEWDKSEATHMAILAAFTSEEPITMEVDSPDGQQKISFDMLVTKIKFISEQEETFNAEIEIQPSGKPDLFDDPVGGA